MRSVDGPCLDALKLEIADFFNGWNSHLLNDSLEKDRTIFFMPFFCKLLVINQLVPI